MTLSHLPTPPAGYVIVTAGKVRPGDLAWDPGTETWSGPSSIDFDVLGREAANFYAIARRKAAGADSVAQASSSGPHQGGSAPAEVLDLARDLYAAAQLAPGEVAEDAVSRIAVMLEAAASAHGAEVAAMRERLRFVDMVYGPKKEERWAALSAQCQHLQDGVDAIKRGLEAAGASLPAPEPQGTSESGILQGLSIALALVEQAFPPPPVNASHERLRRRLAEGLAGGASSAES